MKACMPKCLPLAIAAAFALAACTTDSTRSDVADEREYAPAPAAAPAPAPKRAPTRSTAPATAATPTEPIAPLADDELVGVESCDDYLENYRSCHRVIALYPVDSIESRFQQLRDSLVQRASDPANLDALDQQCESLAADMKTALDGRDCPEDDTLADSSLEDDDRDGVADAVEQDD